MEAEQAGRWEQVLACRAISWNTPMSDEMYFVIFYFLSLLPPTLEPCCGITRGRLWHYMRHVVGMTWVLWRISHWSCHDCLSTLTVHTGVGMYSAIVGACLALSSLEVRRYTWERGSGPNGRKRRVGASEGGGMGGTRRVTCLGCVVVVHINLTLSLSWRLLFVLDVPMVLHPLVVELAFLNHNYLITGTAKCMELLGHSWMRLVGGLQPLWK